VNYTSLTWTQLSNRVSFSDATLIKYLDHLNNKGILCYNNKKYELEDKMLKLWLVHEKEINGKYPY
jgi:DNA-binding IclR family transcriptional regulator